MGAGISFWIRFSLVNLLLVAIIGVLMRFKIAFEIPFFDQKHLLHAHSHFAFGGWISQTLFALMVHFLSNFLHPAAKRKYALILALNLIFAYGMLVSFAAQGYGAVSISFSTASVLISFAFAYYYLRDLSHYLSHHPARPWLRLSLWFNVLSAAGTFALAYMMATHDAPRDPYLASVYFYLHFQYNGWFFFACMGLFYGRLKELTDDLKNHKLIFALFAASCLPAYFLSTLWMNLPVWLYIIVVIAAAAQLVALWLFIKNIKAMAQILRNAITKVEAMVLFAVGLSFTLKILLQLGSTIPVLSKLAFGFRPIVIAYLHLILLGVITSFLLVYMLNSGIVRKSRLTMASLVSFVGGIYLNECILATQGVASFEYKLIPHVNELLLGAAILMMTSLLFLVYTQFRRLAATND